MGQALSETPTVSVRNMIIWNLKMRVRVRKHRTPQTQLAFESKYIRIRTRKGLILYTHIQNKLLSNKRLQPQKPLRMFLRFRCEKVDIKFLKKHNYKGMVFRFSRLYRETYTHYMLLLLYRILDTSGLLVFIYILLASRSSLDQRFESSIMGWGLFCWLLKLVVSV